MIDIIIGISVILGSLIIFRWGIPALFFVLFKSSSNKKITEKDNPLPQDLENQETPNIWRDL